MRAIALIAGAAVAGCSLDSGPSKEPENDSENDAATVSLTFDDTFIDQKAALDLLDQRGMHATFYVNSERIGSSGALSADELLDAQSNGHEIAGHTIGHVNLPTLEPDEQRRRVCDDRVALIDMGFTVTSFAYPFGASDELSEQIVAECGYNSARDIGGKSSPVPPPDPYLVRSAPSVDPETTVEDLEGYVTAAEPDRAWVPIVFHHVCDGCSTIGVAPDTLEAFLDWLDSRGTQVLTVDEVIGGDLQPPVAGPPAVPRRGAGRTGQPASR